MTLEKNMLVLIKHQGALFAFLRTEQGWKLQPIRGEQSMPASSDGCWQKALDELNDMLTNDQGFSHYSVVLVSDQEGLLMGDRLFKVVNHHHITDVQVIKLSWLSERSGTRVPDQQNIDWLLQYVLPELVIVKSQGTEESNEDTQSPELQAAHAQIQRQQQHIEQLVQQEKDLTQQLKSKSQELQTVQTDLQGLRKRSENLYSGDLNLQQLTTLLPALYKNFWSNIRPDELALLADTTEVPQVGSSYLEPSDFVIQSQKKKLLALDSQQKRQLQNFCYQLPRQFTPRPEMQFFFEDEACV
ncbi:hypothetical protein [Oceanospirillum sediminis]|uniref:Uncharacterized protein n=1 Tax=Oceanospirillum sediminis TaxID=2760088 RepID=A0A839IUK1_9GAMM|nr:hypothetical protein [Oceanospirillum sediminis]MBB1488628.1 hypothetical protein [Oceanospirillum sediminis]